MPIGVFDSGIGGLTVLKEVFSSLKKENTLYLGDTARVPYGIRSPETVTRYAFQNIGFLMARGIKLLVVACNTVSAVSLDAIRARLPIPVVGVIGPGARAAVRATRNRRVGVIGTETTISSNAYSRVIKQMDGAIEVFGLPCPLFVPLVEEGITDDAIAVMVARRYLTHLKDEGIDTLVLGCTHYPLLKEIIGKVMGDDIALIDSAAETVMEVQDILIASRLASDAAEKPTRLFFVTDAPEKFVRVGERFLGQPIEDIEKIDIGGAYET